MRRAQQKAEEANFSKSEFLSRMSHELRTPLNGIIGFGELLKMSPLTTRQLQNVERITKAGDHLLDLINEVLDLSSIEAGALNLKMESVRIHQIIDEAIDLTQVLAKGREIVVTLETSIPRDLHIKADTQRIKQVFLNLISNAIKYNVQGGTVQIGAQKKSDSVWRFLVKDSGHGIPPDQIQNVFKPFVRIENNQYETEGTGLGLALTKKLVKAMNGQIGVHPNQNHGCVFWLECEAITPRDQISGSHPQSHSNQLLLPDETHTGSVLYIENNLENLQLVEQVMEARPNVKLLSTTYGMHGLQMAREKQPDLVILDLHLPDCHGREVLQQMKQSEECKNIHVIILSADAMNATIEEMLELGADQYLSKPLKVANFLNTLDRFLP
jgi:CheY-like chemotaxis protein/two-component sensor histidine kinase